jgi:hypothetical protein
VLLRRHDDGRLRGRVARWAGFMPARGALRVDGLWAQGTIEPGPAETVHERPPWPGFATSDVDPVMRKSLDHEHFHFLLSLVDRRTCWAPGGIALTEGPNGWAAASDTGVRWWKDATLADELDRRHADWVARGRPALGDYRVAFVAVADDAAPPPGGWALDRRFFHELVWLEEH